MVEKYALVKKIVLFTVLIVGVVLLWMVFA